MSGQLPSFGYAALQSLQELGRWREVLGSSSHGPLFGTAHVESAPVLEAGLPNIVTRCSEVASQFFGVAGPEKSRLLSFIFVRVVHFPALTEDGLPRNYRGRKPVVNGLAENTRDEFGSRL